jgi:hypothetical protein
MRPSLLDSGFRRVTNGAGFFSVIPANAGIQ